MHYAAAIDEQERKCDKKVCGLFWQVCFYKQNHTDVANTNKLLAQQLKSLHYSREREILCDIEKCLVLLILKGLCLYAVGMLMACIVWHCLRWLTYLLAVN